MKINPILFFIFFILFQQNFTLEYLIDENNLPKSEIDETDLRPINDELNLNFALEALKKNTVTFYLNDEENFNSFFSLISNPDIINHCPIEYWITVNFNMPVSIDNIDQFLTNLNRSEIRFILGNHIEFE